MWPRWGRTSSSRVHHSSSSSPLFRCSSFKDVQTLCSADDEHDDLNDYLSSLSSSDSLQLSRRQQQQQLQQQHSNYHQQCRQQQQRSNSHQQCRQQQQQQHSNSHQQCRQQQQQQRPPSPSAKKIFHRVRVASSLIRNWPSPSRQEAFQSQPQAPPSDISTLIPGSLHRIVVYTTSIRAVRPTFEACKAVQSILTGFRVQIDERDVSMDSGFLQELQSLFGPTTGLPRVFVAGKYVGSAEELRQMHEVGDLKNLLQDLPVADPAACEDCGGCRFVICAECCGSHKVYSNSNSKGKTYGGGGGGGGFRSCKACSPAGLVKCPSCYPAPLADR